jgi:hypothetical protein
VALPDQLIRSAAEYHRAYAVDPTDPVDFAPIDEPADGHHVVNEEIVSGRSFLHLTLSDATDNQIQLKTARISLSDDALTGSPMRSSILLIKNARTTMSGVLIVVKSLARRWAAASRTECQKITDRADTAMLI